MKLTKNLYMPITVSAVCGLIVVMLGGWYKNGSAGGMCLLFLTVGTACTAAMAWLGWYWLKLSDNLTAISRWLGDSKRLKTIPINRSAPEMVRKLIKAINDCFEQRISNVDELEKQLKEMEVQVQLSQRQRFNTEAIIYSIRDAVIVIDEFDRLSMANEAAGNLFGFDFTNARYQPIDELFVADGDAQNFAKILRQSREGRIKATRREIELQRDEAIRTFDCIVSCVYEENKRVCGVVAVLHDITREKEISQMKNDFVSHVSHELKTPLASITAYAEMLIDGEANDKKTQKEFYSVIQTQAERLNRLIEDILNISRIESGLVKINKKPGSMAILIKEQFQMIKKFADEKKITINWGESEEKQIICDQVYADKDMMSQVIVNLLSNAVKYTPSEGSITIENQLSTDENSQEVVRVSIIDTGVGIPEKEIEFVFDKFYRVSAKKNRDQANGTGLGLNLVKQIVEKVHGGRVFVHSKVGKGSTFGFELPLAVKQTVESVR